jgi:integrase
MEGHLEHKLAKRNKARTVRHLAALPYSEMGNFMAELRAASSVPARALEFTILCATRTNETVGALWSELDLHSRLWIVPAIRTKRHREHRVPLSAAAMVVIDAMAKIRQDERMFPVGSDAMWHFLRGLRPGLTVHGFRATFRSWAGGCTTHPRDVCETALGHSIGNTVEQAYQRDALIAKRRVLMADWAEFCASGRAANVVHMDAGRQRSTPENANLSTGFDRNNIRPGISA